MQGFGGIGVQAQLAHGREQLHMGQMRLQQAGQVPDVACGCGCMQYQFAPIAHMF
ncbi:hypothetical protein D3C71_1841430 [compost metagenome]